MLFKLARNTRLLAIPFVDGFFENKYDQVENKEPTKFYSTEDANNVTGWQRLQNLFQKHDEEIPLHPAVVEVVQNSAASFFVGGVYGALNSSRYAFINFIERNEATQFRNHLDAKRKLSDVMFTSYIRGFVKWGSKVCIFVTAFTATQLVLSVYQNKYAFWHYSAGGATAGALYKFQLGPKGMFSGAVFGGFFGSVYGGIKVLILKLTNQTEEDLLKIRSDLKSWKQEWVSRGERKNQMKVQEDELKEAMLSTK